MSFTSEILTFSHFQAKFNPGTAGNSTELPALNLTRNREKVNISNQNVTKFFLSHCIAVMQANNVASHCFT